MLKNKSESVKVVVRCRPLGNKEMEDQRECIVNVDMNACFIQVYNPQNIKDRLHILLQIIFYIQSNSFAYFRKYNGRV